MRIVPGLRPQRLARPMLHDGPPCVSQPAFLIAAGRQ